jgi:hypothetical protein
LSRDSGEKRGEEIKGGHHEPQGQSVSPAKREKIEDVRIQVEKKETEDGRRPGDEFIQEKEGEDEVERISEEVGYPEHELLVSSDHGKDFGEERVQEMIVRDVEIEDRKHVGGEISDIRLGFVDRKRDVERPENLIGDKNQGGCRDEGKIHHVRNFIGKALGYSHLFFLWITIKKENLDVKAVLADCTAVGTIGD